MSDEKLPDGWIKAQSKSHPDRHYYFNTKNKQSAWDLKVRKFTSAKFLNNIFKSFRKYLN
jgi:hypothetical protein